MKLTTYQEVEVEVDLSFQDLTSLISELWIHKDDDGFPLKNKICNIHQCLAAISDEQIAKISPETRAVMVAGFERELERFKTNG